MKNKSLFKKSQVDLEDDMAVDQKPNLNPLNFNEYTTGDYGNKDFHESNKNNLKFKI